MLLYPLAFLIAALASWATAKPLIAAIERLPGLSPAHDASPWSTHTYNIDSTARRLAKRFDVGLPWLPSGHASEGRFNLTRRQQGVEPAGSTVTNATTSALLIKAVKPAATSAVGLDVYASSAMPSLPLGYVLPVKVAGQTLRFQLDTTSYSTWASSANCLSCPSDAARKLPSSVKLADQPFSIEYVADSSWVAGQLVTADMDFGNGLDLPAYKMGAAVYRTSAWIDTPVDGLIGLGLSSLRTDGLKDMPTPLEALKAAGKISNARLGFAFGRIKGSSTDGEIAFGEPDTSKYTGTPTETTNAVDSAGLWALPMTALQVGTSAAMTFPSPMISYIDTETELILAPIDVAFAMHEQIPDAKADYIGSFYIPCDTTASIKMTIGGSDITIPAADLAYLPQGDGTCLSSIVGMSSELFILGGPFLRNVYLTIDADTKSIFLAPRAA